MHGFQEWFNLNESFKLPFKVIEDIYNHTKQVYKDRIHKPRTAIPDKSFSLDLSGTNYEFLNKYSPTVNVAYKSLPGDDAAYYHGLKIKHDISNPLSNNKIIGDITIGLNRNWMYVSDNIEHEVLHFIQDLIKIDQRKPNSREPLHGGLPKIPMVKRIMDDRGLSVQGRKDKMRTKHHFRPIEFYTNLNTYTNYIKSWYMDHQKRLGVTDLEKASKDTEEKKKYFNDMLKKSNGISKRLAELKKLDKELYEKYLQEITKNFIFDDSWYEDYARSKGDYNDLGRIEMDFEYDKKQKALQKTSRSLGGFKVSDFVGKIAIDWHDRDMFSKLEDGNFDAGEEFLDIVGGNIKMNKWTDQPDFINLSFNASKLRKIFDGIKILKNKQSETYLKANVDYGAVMLAQIVAKGIKGDNKPKYTDILALFYPPPYTLGKKNSEGKYIED